MAAVAFTPILQSVSRTMVSAWEVVRRDGARIRVTNADVPIWIDGLEFTPGSDTDPKLPRGGADGAQVRREAALKEHSTAIQGLVASDYITEADLRAGRYRDAVVRHWMVDARYPFAGAIYKEWSVADIQWTTEGVWSAQLVSAATSRLSHRVGEVTTRTCRNKLFSTDGLNTCGRPRTPGGNDPLLPGQWQCGVQAGNYLIVSDVLSPRQIEVRTPAITISGYSSTTINGVLYQVVTTASPHGFSGQDPIPGAPIRFPVWVSGHSVSAINREYVQAEVISATEWRAPWVGASIHAIEGVCFLKPPEGFFASGEGSWRTGANHALSIEIEDSAAFVEDVSAGFAAKAVITLLAETPLPVQVGDTLALIAGCDGTPGVCLGTFENLVNFRGEPTMTEAGELARSTTTN